MRVADASPKLSPKDAKLIALFGVTVGAYLLFLLRTAERQERFDSEFIKMAREHHAARMQLILKEVLRGRSSNPNPCGIAFTAPPSGDTAVDFVVRSEHSPACEGCRKIFHTLTGQELAADSLGNGPERVSSLSLVPGKESKVYVDRAPREDGECDA